MGSALRIPEIESAPESAMLESAPIGLTVGIFALKGRRLVAILRLLLLLLLAGLCFALDRGPVLRQRHGARLLEGLCWTAY